MLLKLVTAAAAATAGVVVALRLWKDSTQRQAAEGCRPVESLEGIRAQLPRDLWYPEGEGTEPIDAIWALLEGVLRQHGLDVWKHRFATCVWPGSDDQKPTCGGFGYATSYRGRGRRQGQVGFFNRFDYTNASSRPARCRDGRDVIVRVICIGNKGRTHLDILRKVAHGQMSLFSDNHALPLLDTIEFEDITFGLFPMSGFSLATTYKSWAQNSVGDVVNMIMQALEGLAFLHRHGIAHRDAFPSNFLVQWQPESMALGAPCVSQPRVYLIDFECAVAFPDGCPSEERVCVGYPLAGSLEGCPLDEYCRGVPPEVESGRPYDPFKLDVWQLGTGLSDLRTTIPEIDEALLAMINPEAATRVTASRALERLVEVLSSMPPRALLIKPEYVR
ncbi:kinase-like domain-containing protein [Phanerochaete sordida]|uniref:Kinase-like domain-containing protein n=1 Tax=Phanerochaete sordida TaxID=48140 RepID=A0A9P3LAH4_9APHY|nr:kinase-like domain-containing protein [Phanerochaete sordida]